MRRTPDSAVARHLTRRRLVIGGVATVGLVAGGAVASRAFEDDGADGVVPQVRPGRLLTGSFSSAARRGQRCGWALALPPGHSRDLPVAVVLHGRGNDHASAFSPGYLGLDRFLAATVAGGTPPFALVSVDGGESYWHARDDGDDAPAMIVDELLPLVARHGVRTDRVGLLGWSMGGFGALHLAGSLGPDRVAAVAVMSPALWRDYADTAPGAYDDADDFAAVDVTSRQESLRGIPVRIDCGRSDPFAAATRDYVRGFERRPAGGFQPGRHTVGYWRRMAPRQLAFLGDHFAASARGDRGGPLAPPDSVSA